MGTVVLTLVVPYLVVPAPTVAAGSCNDDLTAGFRRRSSRSPYDVPVEQRYRHDACTGGHDYSSGAWHFKGYGYVPSGASGVSRGGLEDCVYDRWFRLNVVHDVGASTVAVHVDGGAPRLSHYFKFGVYVQHHDVSPCVESRWRNITGYTKPH
ncbi:hypothetical protein BAE44_0006991 [Dichanthelium oligosanthes]|uniref:Secreted protein n=1 Tax=Dichanthelium oligosanthes TaxID=888268 RepID=A0A1E5W3L5_9POAL|nr:hypothetical protein BAE44_0006991 [Dichanthelium oligosanthes]